MSATPVHLSTTFTQPPLSPPPLPSSILWSEEVLRARVPQLFTQAAGWRSSEAGPTTRQLASSVKDGGGADFIFSNLHPPCSAPVHRGELSEKIDGDERRSYELIPSITVRIFDLFLEGKEP
jgi:hypothetical protein